MPSSVSGSPATQTTPPAGVYGGSEGPAPEEKMREIDVDRLEELMAEGAVVVDVREPMEFAQAHVPGATLIPMGRLTERLDELDRAAPVLLICRSGHRSAVMCEVLAGHGFDAINVAGGTLAWIRAGKPYETGPG
jgi:rhodanese-related sulfurtransferase